MTRDSGQDALALQLQVARMYHLQGLSQAQIARELHFSQSRISRILTKAERSGIVQVRIVVPKDYYAEIERALESAYGLDRVVIAPCPEESDGSARRELLESLGERTAEYLVETLSAHDWIGLSSWSETLLAAAEAMPRGGVASGQGVVQLIGGVGRTQVQVQATRLAEEFGRIADAPVTFLPAPGIVANPETSRALLRDPAVNGAVQAWGEVTVALVGIGSLAPSDLIFQSGNSLSSVEQAGLRDRGAVGDVVLRFFDSEGRPIHTDIADRIVGIPEDQFLRIPRRVGVAGGADKHAAILGAVRGGWVNVLVTDEAAARHLLSQAQEQAAARRAPVTAIR